MVKEDSTMSVTIPEETEVLLATFPIDIHTSYTDACDPLGHYCDLPEVPILAKFSKHFGN